MVDVNIRGLYENINQIFNDKEVRAAWNEENNKWYFSVLDIIGAIRKEDNYEKCRNYWKYLKAKLKKRTASWLVPLPN